MIVHIDERTARRVLAGAVAAMVAAHLVVVGAGLRGATALDLSQRQSLGRWAVVAGLLLAAGLAALLARGTPTRAERQRWRVFGWTATLASVDAVAAVGPGGAVGCRIATEVPWTVAAVALVAAAAVWALFLTRSDRARARGWALALAVYVAGLVLGADGSPNSVAGRVLTLAAAAGFVLVAVHRAERLGGAEARAQVLPVGAALSRRGPGAPAD